MVRREGWSSGRVGVHEVWQTCSVNCGSRCALRLQVRDGEILWTETDCGDEEPGNLQMRACLRGRALRYWLGSPDRLNEPLRRVGPRGSGQFEPISWDEALDEIAERIRDTVAQWGNEAVLLPYATAIWSGSGSPFERLMNCYGGHLGIYGDYSCMQLQTACTSLFGDDGYYTGSLLSEASHADLVVFFGANPALTRMGGASGAHRLAQAREAAAREGRPFRVIAIDPCQSDAATGESDAWIPVRPGTDAAFVAGVAWVLITEGLADEEFLHRYCIGYDGATMPAGAPASESYRAYVLGEGRTVWRRRRSGPRASPGAPRRASPLSRASWPAQGGRSSCRAGARSARPSASNRPERSACFPCLRATSVFPARTAAPASGFSGPCFPTIRWGRTRLMWPSPRFSGRARSSGGALLRPPTACAASTGCPRR